MNRFISPTAHHSSKRVPELVRHVLQSSLAAQESALVGGAAQETSSASTWQAEIGMLQKIRPVLTNNEKTALSCPTSPTRTNSCLLAILPTNSHPSIAQY